MFFLARVKVIKTPYMNASQEYTAHHLVEAEDECEAAKKVEKFYDAKCDSYSVSYRVGDVDISETIT